jgi:hypothetical protein
VNARGDRLRDPAKLVIDEEQARVIRALSKMSADGHGLTKILRARRPCLHAARAEGSRPARSERCAASAHRLAGTRHARKETPQGDCQALSGPRRSRAAAMSCAPRPGSGRSSKWCRRRDLNPRPPAYEADALPTELRRHGRRVLCLRPTPSAPRRNDTISNRAPSAGAAHPDDDIDAGLLGAWW